MILSLIIITAVFGWITWSYYSYQQTLTNPESKLKSAAGALGAGATFTVLIIVGMGIGPWTR